MSRSRQRGFTLLEMIMVMVIITLASVPILGQFTQAGSTLLIDEEIQTAAQLAQARAETLLADRRANGYAAIAAGTVNETLAGNFAGYTRSTTVNQPPVGSGCAVGASCKEVIISVSRGGNTRSEITFILVDY